ncbi:hypothetical protein [Phaeobacter inhibens]|uniref:hypothetical protein n=1 Tax=Phaeobacter inhibens TaxID=221822 RepID=UPI0021A52488|nr:hypothetical protein [Phaeobacter inhibens]UWR49789.1 hypothetical protein K4F87_03295 [Phaeobacter inhibens]UWR61418.1 hypothetical protein K4F88_03505 [Phaeobacter inhibens]
MITHVNLIKIFIDAVVNGTLALEEEKGRVRFELSGEACSVRGPMIARRDWLDAQGRPGLMSMINQVEFEGVETNYAELFQEAQEYEEVVACRLQERLAPEKLYTLDQDRGWVLSAYDSVAISEQDDVSA